MKPMEYMQHRPKLKRRGIIALGLITGYAVLGFLLVPWLIEKNLPAISQSALGGREITVENIDINPFSFSVSVDNLHIKGLHGEPFAGFDQLHLNFQTSSLFYTAWTFDTLSIIKPYGHLNINNQGQLNIADLTEPNPPQTPTPANTDWEMPRILFLTLVIDNANIYIQDQSKQQTFEATIGPITINVEGLTTLRGKKAPYKLKARSGDGLIGSKQAWEGVISINPLSSYGKINIQDIYLPKAWSYFADQLKFEVKKGLLDINMNYNIDYIDNKWMLSINNASTLLNELQITQKGNGNVLIEIRDLLTRGIQYDPYKSHLHINNLELKDSNYHLVLGKQGNNHLTQLVIDALLALLRLEKIDFTLEPIKLNIAKLHLIEPIAEFNINKDGLNSLNRILISKENRHRPPAAATLASQIALNEFILQKAQLVFHDNSITPYFEMEVNNLNGNITGLSSDTNSKAQMAINGKINRFAPIRFTGELNFLAEDIFANIILSINNMDMVGFTPYTGTYAGREIAKGKLNLNMDFRVANHQLNIKNKLFLDQFTLSENFESDQASKLPLGLAVSLLKNSKGEIHIDLPINGDLDDPNFRYGQIVWEALSNAVVKTAAAPFKLLSSLVNSDADLGTIAFKPGRFDIDKQIKKNLQQLEQALTKRPSLNLEISGCYSKVQDGPALKLQQIKQKINSENEELSAKKYLALLSQYYQQSKQNKPVLADNLNMNTQQLVERHIPKLEQDLILAEVLNIGAYQKLASNRHNVIKQAFISSGVIAPERLFSIGINELATEKKLECELKLH